METEHRAVPAPADEPDLGVLPATQHVAGQDPRLAPGHVHAVNPENDTPVTIQPGELMPGWLLGALLAGATLAMEGPGVFRLVPAPKGGRR